MAPMGADYSFELISIEIDAPQIFGRNKIFLGSVMHSANSCNWREK